MLYLILSMMLWGTLGIFVLWSNLPAIDIAFYRCFIGALLMGLWLIKQKESIQFNKNTAIIALAGVCLVVNWLFLFKSFQVSNITIGNMSYYLQPILLILLGILFYREKVNAKKWGLISLAFCGVVLTIDWRNFSSPQIVEGCLFALLAALLYSFLTILMKNNTSNFFKVLFIQLSIGVIILAPMTHFQMVTVTALTCILVIAILHTVVAYFFYYQAIKTTSFSQIAIVSYLDPIVAILTDILFFQRQFNGLQITGIVLTFVSLYFLVTAARSKKIIAA